MLALCLAASPAHAGGPLIVQFSGAPYKWSTTGPIPYSTDGGSLGLWSNATALANAAQAFNRWGPDLPTSILTFSSAGSIPGDGDVNTVAEFVALDGNCADGISPVIFDANGTLFAALGLPSSVIAIAGPDCAVGGTIVQSFAAVNGKWYDGNSGNGELTEDELKGVLVHEFGHWLNLDHSQTNGHYFMSDVDPGFTAFGPPPLASVEIMFPFAIGGATVPQKDDVAAVSMMYPASGFASTTGTITGTIRYPNAITPFLGANVIARNVADPYYDAVSNVSGRPYAIPSSLGEYELPGLTAGASYSVEMVNVRSNFTAGSSVGPLDPPAVIPAPEEFYNGANEASSNPPDNTAVYTSVASTAGVVTSGTDIIMNGAQANLSLTKSDSPDPAVVGQNLVYTLTVVNGGPSTATSVVVTDTLPGGVTYVSATPSLGSCSQTGGIVTCGLSSMANGVTRVVTIVVTPTASGMITNSATVLATEGDPNTANNSASATTTVNPASADLSVTLNDFPDPVTVGAQVSYTATVANAGPSPATAVTLTDVLPASLTWVSATSSVGSCTESAGTVTCALGTLASGAGATVSITTTATTVTTVTNTVSVSGSTSDPSPGNNSASATTTVVTALDNRLINISTRAFVGTGSNVAVGGFIISGAGTKQVLLRGFGPTLADFGVVGALANPTLDLEWDDDSNPNTPAILILSNNDWGTPVASCNAPVVACGTPTDIFNTGMSADSYAPTNPNRGLDAALLLTLPPGTYTARLSGVSGGTGVGLIGVDDLDTNQTATLVNISTRAFVGTGSNVAVGGFIITGTGPKAVLIRAFGPTLTSFGVAGALGNPTLDLEWDDDSNPNTPALLVLTNDNWGVALGSCPAPVVACGMPTDIVNTGMSADSYAPTNPNRGLDAALLVTLPPGTYTTTLRGVGSGTGVGLIGVDEVGP